MGKCREVRPTLNRRYARALCRLLFANTRLFTAGCHLIIINMSLSREHCSPWADITHKLFCYYIWFGSFMPQPLPTLNGDRWHSCCFRLRAPGLFETFNVDRNAQSIHGIAFIVCGGHFGHSPRDSNGACANVTADSPQADPTRLCDVGAASNDAAPTSHRRVEGVAWRWLESKWLWQLQMGMLTYLPGNSRRWRSWNINSSWWQMLLLALQSSLLTFLLTTIVMFGLRHSRFQPFHVANFFSDFKKGASKLLNSCLGAVHYVQMQLCEAIF